MAFVYLIATVNILQGQLKTGPQTRVYLVKDAYCKTPPKEVMSWLNLVTLFTGISTFVGYLISKLSL